MKLLGVLLLVVWAVSARADSDGYYCHTGDYLAYETQWGDGFEYPSGEHRLHVVVFDRDFPVTASIGLPGFQTHGMLCGASGVVLLGWLDTHRVDLSSESDLVSAGTAPLPPGCVDGGRPAIAFEGCSLGPFEQQNLGHLARPGTRVLGESGDKGTVSLQVEKTETPQEGGLAHATRTSLVWKPQTGVATSLAIFDGVGFEPIH